MAHNQNKILDTLNKRKKLDKIELGIPDYRIQQRFRIFRSGEVFVIKSLVSGLNLDV